MKRILLFALALTVSGAFAQSFEIHDEDGNNVTGTTFTVAGPNSPSDPWFKYTNDFEVINTTGATITTKVKRIETSVLSGSAHYHCFGICYTDIDAGTDAIFPESGDTEFFDFLDIPSGDSAAINVYLKPKSAVGTATFRFVAFNDSDPTDSAYVDIEYAIHAFTGVEELKNNLDVSMYPNPASQQSTLTFSGNENESGSMVIEVADMLGKIHQDLQVSASSTRVNLNTETLRSGIYFVSIRKDGQLLRSSKLVVKH